MPSYFRGKSRPKRVVSARFRVIGEDGEPAGPHRAVRSTNIGAGGAFFHTEDPVPVGTRIVMEIQIPPGKLIVTLAHVRWTRDEDDDSIHGMGIKYTLGEKDLLILGDYLATETGRFTAA